MRGLFVIAIIICVIRTGIPNRTMHLILPIEEEIQPAPIDPNIEERTLRVASEMRN